MTTLPRSVANRPDWTEMLMTQSQLAAALDKISERLGIAGNAFEAHVVDDDDWAANSAA